MDGWGGCKFKVLLSLSVAIAKGFCAYKVDSKSSTRTLQRRKAYYMHKVCRSGYGEHMLSNSETKNRWKRRKNRNCKNQQDCGFSLHDTDMVKLVFYN